MNYLATFRGHATTMDYGAMTTDADVGGTDAAKYYCTQNGRIRWWWSALVVITKWTIGLVARCSSSRRRRQWP